MIVTKKALPRRTFLRGTGATLSLPLLDAMVPSLTALAMTPAKPVRRLGFVYMADGQRYHSLDAPGRRRQAGRTLAHAVLADSGGLTISRSSRTWS